MIYPLLGPVRDHVDSDFIRYVVLQQGRAARVLPPCVAQILHACDVNTAVLLSLHDIIEY